MKKTILFKLLALAATISATACGTTTSTNGSTTDTQTGTDTTATDTVAGDTTTADTTGSSDTVAGTDTTTTDTGGGGGENMCTFTKPTTNPGCTSPDDLAWIELVSKDTSGDLDSNFGNIVSNATLKQGCLAQGAECATPEEKAIAQGKCIRDKILETCKKLADTDKDSAKCTKISANCAWCYGEYSGQCGFQFCLSDCAVDSSSTACRDCLKTNCDVKRDACKDGK